MGDAHTTPPPLVDAHPSRLPRHSKLQLLQQQARELTYDGASLQALAAIHRHLTDAEREAAAAAEQARYTYTWWHTLSPAGSQWRYLLLLAVTSNLLCKGPARLLCLQHRWRAAAPTHPTLIHCGRATSHAPLCLSVGVCCAAVIRAAGPGV